MDSFALKNMLAVWVKCFHATIDQGHRATPRAGPGPDREVQGGPGQTAGLSQLALVLPGVGILQASRVVSLPTCPGPRPRGRPVPLIDGGVEALGPALQHTF